MYTLYTILTAALVVLALPALLWRERGTGKYRRTFRERMGFSANGLPKAGAPCVWVHAVSVGEALAARPLVERLKERFPETPVYVSTTTMTGRAVAERSLGRADGLFYAPFDWPRPVRRTLRRLNPRLLVLVETEIWPNLIHEARRHGARVVLVNGRISRRSFVRYSWIRGLLARVLAEMDLFLMQSEVHAERIRRMGAPPERVQAFGNLKFEAVPRHIAAAELLKRLGGRGPLFVAGSTVLGEEEAVLAAYRALKKAAPEARLLLAPRHPERFSAVFEMARATGFTCARRSGLGGSWEGADVLLLDTLGELAQVYSAATVVFVGGSLVPTGGHNVLEAAVHGKAIVVGPHMENFQEIADLFLGAEAMLQVAGASALPDAIVDLATDPGRRQRMGEAAQNLMERHQGALDRTIDALAPLLA